MNLGDRKRLIAIGLGTVLLAVVAFAELNRVENGTVFLISMPWESPPSRVELIDANRTAARYLWLAPVAILAVGFVIGCASLSIDESTQRAKYWKLLLALLIVSALADMATTIWFFHTKGIDHEVHPAIRLLGYAYGRTVGPVLGKVIQTIGIIYLAPRLRRIGPWIVVIAIVHYLGAAIYNLVSM